MRTFSCQCKNRLFFHSTRCVQCQVATGLCEQCRRIVPLVPRPDGTLECGNEACRTRLHKCANYEQHLVCNGTVVAALATPAGSSSAGSSHAQTPSPATLCRYCALTSVVPDLTIAGHLEKWKRLEAAKARVLYGVELLDLPIASSTFVSADLATVTSNRNPPRLTFQFLDDAAGPVTTGHSNGCITINLREADPIEREKTRVQFGEPQRTLVGHFRHELGHYYWDLLVAPDRLDAFRELFGNEREPDYTTAQQHYYSNGPQAGWSMHFISAYATMHPWEDFAETFGAYLDLVTILDTAKHFGMTECELDDLSPMLRHYQSIGVMANEHNRDMGLVDLVPEVFTPAIEQKLLFVHTLRRLSEKQRVAVKTPMRRPA